SIQRHGSLIKKGSFEPAWMALETGPRLSRSNSRKASAMRSPAKSPSHAVKPQDLKLRSAPKWASRFPAGLQFHRNQERTFWYERVSMRSRSKATRGAFCTDT